MEKEDNVQPVSRSFGMNSFVSDHSGFSGKIKCDCKDFEVTEIDPCGKMVHLDDTYNIPVTYVTNGKTSSKDGQSDSGSSDLKKDHVKQVDAEEDTYKKRKTDLSSPHSVQSDDGCRNDTNESQNVGDSGDDLNQRYLARLSKILGEDLLQKLTDFAASEYNLNKSNTNTDSHVRAGSNALSVGVIALKETRTEIHKQINYVFPHLCTKVQKPSDSSEDGLEITVHSDDIYWAFYSCLAVSQIDDFIRFVDAKDVARTFSLSNSGGKEERTQIHRLVARHYGAFLETKTFVSTLIDSDGAEKIAHEIIVRYRQKFQQRGARGRGQKRKVAEQETVFTGFVLKKENLETLDAINKIANSMRIQPSQFSYAGIKDKKAVTTQIMCVKGVTTDRLKKWITSKHIPDVTLGNIQQCQGPIQMGQLYGNHFNLVIRDIKLRNPSISDDGGKMAAIKQEVAKALENVKVNMFINYFGQQRFGSSTDTQGNAANIGLAILKGDNVKAVKLLLSPEPGRDDTANKAKQYYQDTQNAKTALHMMPTFKTRECLLLKALHRHGTDDEGCTKALLNIPHTMRQLYVHSYCSLVWNHMSTLRMRLYGHQRLVEGDLVLPAGTAKAETRDQVQFVGKETINSNTFTIQDLVLPLPGNAIQYPSNQLGEHYREYLEHDGLTHCTFRINPLKINIPGDYRRVLARPENVTYSLYHGSAPNQDNSRCMSNMPSGNMATGDDLINLRLSFNLPASSYATVCLREIMKE